MKQANSALIKSITKRDPKINQKDYAENSYNALFDFSNEDYLPNEKEHLIISFFQNQIRYPIVDRNMEDITGLYKGTIGGSDVKPHGLGEWKFYDTEKKYQICYSGKWQNGLWHGIGNFYEAFEANNTKVSVEISDALFFNGKLVSGESSSNAHITINKSIDDGRTLEIHLYGQIKENETKNCLRFLEEALFSKNFYFHNETTRNSFQKLTQIHITGNYLREEGYQIIGSWIVDDKNNYKLGNVLKNEIEDEERMTSDSTTLNELENLKNETGLLEYLS